MSGGICAGDLKMNIQRYEEALEELGISIRLMESGIQLGKISSTSAFCLLALQYLYFLFLKGSANCTKYIFRLFSPLQHLSDNQNDLCIKSSITHKS